MLDEAKRYSSIDFTPPKEVAAAAKRGLELRRKHGKGGLTTQKAGSEGVGSGVARATTLANRKAVKPETIKRMLSFFARHARNNKGPEGSPGRVAWLLWGGDPGLRWAKKVKGQMAKIDESRTTVRSSIQVLDEMRQMLESEGSVKLDTAKYEKELRDKIMDMQRDSMERHVRSREKEVDTSRVVKVLSSLDRLREAEKLVKAYEESDSKEFARVYISLLKDRDISISDEWFDLRMVIRAMQDSIEAPWTKEEAERDIAGILNQTIEAQNKNARTIEKAIARAEEWNGSAIVIQPMVADALEAATTSNVTIKGSDIGFTLFGDGTVEDVLEAGDREFFKQSEQEQDYFNLVREIENPGSTSRKGKLLRLYTARPLRDRKDFQKAARKKEIPNNIFLTDDMEEAEGYALEYPPRDVWEVQIYEKYVTKTQTRTMGGRAGNWQTLGPKDKAPIKDMSIVLAVD